MMMCVELEIEDELSKWQCRQLIKLKNHQNKEEKVNSGVYYYQDI